MKPVPTGGFAISTLPTRRALRATLIATREALDDATRVCFDQRISTTLATRLRVTPVTSIGGYWPMRGETDLRAAMHAWHAGGIVVALPQVVDANQGLRFVRWSPQAVLRTTRFGAEIVEPDVFCEVDPELLLIPCVGFNADRYRLGYGGGYYDRTLAARRVKSWGIAYECCRIDDLRTEKHDVALDAIITETTVY